MKFLLFIFVSLPFAAFGQKHDYMWIIGDNNTTSTITHGGATINFNYNPRSVYYNFRKLNMYLTNSSICDSMGNLLFYSNGCDIAGADDDYIVNGTMGEVMAPPSKSMDCTL